MGVGKLSISVSRKGLKMQRELPNGDAGLADTHIPEENNLVIDDGLP